MHAVKIYCFLVKKKQRVLERLWVSLSEGFLGLGVVRKEPRDGMPWESPGGTLRGTGRERDQAGIGNVWNGIT
jgi:hypothetical protein